MNTMNIQVAVDDFIRYCSIERNYSHRTIEAYCDALRSFISHVGDSCIMETIHITDIRMYVGELHNQGFATNSIRQKLAAVKSLFRFSLKRGIVSANPASGIISPKKTKKLPAFLQPQEVLNLLKQFDTSTPEGLRNFTIVELLYGSGLRISELCSLRVNNIQWHDNTLRIVGKGNKERIVPMSVSAVQTLQLWLSRRTSILREFTTIQNDTIFINSNG